MFWASVLYPQTPKMAKNREKLTTKLTTRTLLILSGGDGSSDVHVMLHVNRRALRRVQAAAVLWVVYGVLIHAFPVVVANSIVASVALYSSFGAAMRPSSPAVVSYGLWGTPFPQRLICRRPTL
jgi:hypothetical protein